MTSITRSSPLIQYTKYVRIGFFVSSSISLSLLWLLGNQNHLFITQQLSTWSNNQDREFDIGGIFRNEFVTTGQTVKQVYCLEVLKRLREKVRR